MNTRSLPTRSDLFLWCFRFSTPERDDSYETQVIHMQPWDQMPAQPQLLDIFAYHTLAMPEQRTPIETLFRVLSDHCELPVHWHAFAPDSRINPRRPGPYWAVLNGAGPSDLVRSIVNTKRRACVRGGERFLSHFTQYLVFNQETDDEIARLSEAGTCPIREWNRSPHGWTARVR